MRSSRWHRLTLIAWVAATGTAGAQVTAPTDAGLAPPPAPASLPDADAPADREWRLPPLRLSGTLSFDTRVSRGNGSAASSAHLLSGTLGTSTYIYQPWFATLSGSIGLTSSWTSVGGGSLLLDSPSAGDSQLHERIRTQELFLSGDARLDLFPRSRFPAEIHFSRQDSRTDAGLASAIDFKRQNFGFSQRYRPASGAWNVMGSFEHNDQSGLGFRHRQDAFTADFSANWKHHEFGLGGSYSRARSDDDDDSRFTTLVARHTYTPSSALSVNSTGNLTRTEDRGGGLASDLRVMQLSSVGFYHRENSPLTLTGSLRGLMLRESFSDTTVDSLGGSVGANYELNPNLRLSANGGASISRSAGGGNATSVSGSVGAAYQGDSLVFRGIEYNWFGGATVGVAMAAGNHEPDETEATLGVQIGHSASRSWRLGPQSTFSLSAAQSLSLNSVHSNRDEASLGGLGQSRALLNTLSATWQKSSDTRSAYARVSYSDSVEFGGGRARFQMANVQLSGNWDLGYGRSLTGDLTYQRTIQRASELTLAESLLESDIRRNRSSGAAGEITFRQNHLFGVPRLRFVSRVRLAQDVLRQPGQLLSIPDRETRLWENRLDWSIGRLETQAILRFSQIDGRRVDSIWFRVQRTFGN
jgi:hypothetical protein